MLLSLNLATTFSVSANGMIFGDKYYFDIFWENALNIFKISTIDCGQLHYPFVMFEMKTSTKLNYCKKESDKEKKIILFCINLLINLSPDKKKN